MTQYLPLKCVNRYENIVTRNNIELRMGNKIWIEGLIFIDIHNV